MMKRLLLVLLPLLLLAQSAAGDTCTSLAGERVAMTAIGTAGIWDPAGPCTPSIDDDFIVSGNSRVTIAGGTLGAPIIMNSLTLNGAGATLRIAPGAVVQVTVGITLTAGTYIQEGAVLAEGRIKSVSFGAWAAGNVVTLDADPSGTVAAGDYLVVGNEDPENAQITTPVQTRAGPREIGASYRPSFARGKWFRITNVTGAAITISNDEYVHQLGGAYGAGANSPYMGQRTVPIIAAHTPAAAFVRERYGFSSYVDITEVSCTGGSTPGDCALVDGDLGSMYVQWVSAGGRCEGISAKIIHSLTDTPGAGTDRIWVSGDASVCGTEQIVITNGLRQGDKVYLVRPATINGNKTGHFTADFGGTTVRMKWFRFIQPDYFSMSSIGGATEYCNTCLFNTAGTPNYASASYIGKGELAWPTVHTSDTSVLGQMGADNAGDPLGGVLWDASGMVVEDLYIHDQLINQAATFAGAHGIYNRAGRGMHVNRLRVERLADDLLGSRFSRLGASNDGYIVVTDAILYEQHPATANTDSCLDMSDVDILPPNLGTVLTSIIATGCGAHTLDGVGWAQMHRGLVAGGAAGEATNSSGNIWLRAPFTPMAGYPAGTVDLYPGTIEDSILYGMGGTGDVNPIFDFMGNLKNSIVSFPIVDGSMQSATGVYNSFLDMGGATQILGGATNWRGPSTTIFQDSVIQHWRTSAGSANFASSSPATNGLTTLVFDRVYYLVDGFPIGTGILGVGLNDASGVTVTIRNFIGTEEVPTTTSFYSYTSTGNGANVSNTCMDVTGAVITTGTQGVGINAPASNWNVPGYGINGNADVGLRAFQAVGSEGCDSFGPRQLGLSKFYVSHALLGDLWMEQYRNFSTSDVVRLHTAGGGGSNRTVY